MSRTLYLFVIFAATFLLGAGFFGNDATEIKRDWVNNPADLAPVEPGTIVVRFKPEAVPAAGSDKSANSLFGKLVGQNVQLTLEPSFNGVSTKTTSSKGASVLDQLYNVHFDESINPYDIARQISRSPAVQYAEPRFLRFTTDRPSDPMITSQAQFARVNAEAAWDVIKSEEGDVIVAVVDGGTDHTHFDLTGNLWTNPDEVDNNGIDDDNNGFIDDLIGWNFQEGTNDPANTNPDTPGNGVHGTHVSGILGAVTNNDLGISSLSWNPQVMNINAASRLSDRAIAFGFEGIAYAALNGADIINCSWGSNSFSAAEQDVIDMAYDLGALVIAAAGNDGSLNDIKPHYPSDLRKVLSVGSTDATSDVKSGFSNFGVTVDVFAPGNGITSTSPGGAFVSLGGTSMSSPMVAALAALVKTKNPTWSVDQVREQIRVTSDPIESSNTLFSGLLGRGRINAFRAVTEFSHPSVRVEQISLDDSQGNSDGVLGRGERSTVTVRLRNYLAAASGVEAQIVALAPDDVVIHSASFNLGDIASDESAEFEFDITPDGSLIDGHVLRFRVDLNVSGVTDRDLFTMVVSPPGFVTHETGRITASVTTRGNIGYNGFQNPESGDGFRLDGRDMLFEGSLMLGTNSARVSDGVRASNGLLDNDFQPERGQILALQSPGLVTFEQTSVVLTDSIAPNPLFVSVTQESYADRSEEYQNFIFLRYIVKNNSAVPLIGARLGLFVDWDVNPDAIDYSNYDPDRWMAIVKNKSDAPGEQADLFAGTMVLTRKFEPLFKNINNAQINGGNGYTPAEKWADLSNGVQNVTIQAADVSTLVGASLPLIPPGGSVQVGFAVLGATSLQELNNAADNALDLWNATLVPNARDEPPLPDVFTLGANYPNPFNPSTAIPFELSAPSNVVLEVFDVLGRRVRTLENSQKAAGTYTIQWDGRNDAGTVLSSGVYFARMSINGNSTNVRVRKLTMTK